MTYQNMQRRTYLASLAAAGVAGLAGCTGGEAAETGTLATQVTDQPGDIGDFESCVVTVTGMWLGPRSAVDEDDGSRTETDDSAENTTDAEEDGDDTAEDAGDDQDAGGADEDAEDADRDSDGREYYEFDEPREADLVELQGEETQLVDERELDVAEYAFLQLDTDGADATLEDGSSADVRVPGEAPLTFNESFEIRAETRTTFTADFMPVRRGQTGSYNLQPVAKGITVSYEES